MGNLLITVFLENRWLTRALQIYVQALASLISHQINWSVHDLLTCEKTKGSSLRKEVHDSLLFFFLNNSFMAKHRASSNSQES